MLSERKQEIAKAKLKKARQQLNVQANPQQVQVGGNTSVATPTQPTVMPAGSPIVTPPQANVPRKAQVGRPARVAKPSPHHQLQLQLRHQRKLPHQSPRDKE